MKTLNRRSLIILLLALVLSFSLAIALNANGNALATESPKTFTMVEGAQVKLNGDGIRFIVKMDWDTYGEIYENEDVTLSVIVAPIDKMQEANGDFLGMDKKVKIAIDEETFYNNVDGYCYANAVIANLNKDNNNSITTSQFDYDFTAVGVIEREGQAPEYTDNKEDLAKNTRSQYDLLQSAVLDTVNEGVAEEAIEAITKANSPYAWFGTDEYPIVIDTAEKYDALKTQINNEIAFDLDVKVETDKFDMADSKVELDQGKELPESVKEYYTVSFYNGSTLLTSKSVAKGGSVNFDETAPTKSSDGWFTYTFADAWTTENGGDTVADLASVNENMSVYAKFNEISPRTGDDANTVFFFGETEGKEQLTRLLNLTSIGDVDTNVKLSNENGTHRISAQNAKGTNNWVQLTYDLKGYEFNTGDVVVFDVYVDLDEETEFVEIRWSDKYSTRATNKQWSKVIVESSGLHNTGVLKMAACYYSLTGSSGDYNSLGFNGSVYFSKAKAVPASSVITTSTEGQEFTFGSQNIEYVGGKGSGAHGWIGNWVPGRNTTVYCQVVNTQPQIIDGTLTYYMQGDYDLTSTATNKIRPAMVLDLKNSFNITKTTVIKVTIRGVVKDKTLTIGFIGEGKNTGTKSDGVISESADGYTTYTFNKFGGWGGELCEEFTIWAYGNNGLTRPYYYQVNIADITFENVTWNS